MTAPGLSAPTSDLGKAGVGAGILRRPIGCQIPGCGRPIDAFGLCGTHDYRLKRYGDPLAEIPVGVNRHLLDPAAGEIRDGEDVDEVALDSVMAGHRAKLNVPERRVAVYRLTVRGCSLEEIARLVGCTARTVSRTRARMAVPGEGHSRWRAWRQEAAS